MTEIDKWKKYIFSLPEQVFFEIIRNYLGDVRTPFNKHDLVDKLTAFLMKDETSSKVISLLDQSDAEMLTAVSILDSPSVKQLYQVFSSKKSYYDFYLTLLNLEERMLIYREEREGEGVISISPVYRNIFNREVIDAEHLIKSYPPEAEDKNTEIDSAVKYIWLNDSVIFSIFSFLLRKEQILKLDGSFRKKVVEELMDIFPEKLAADSENRVDLVRNIIKRLSLVIQEEDSFRPAVERWLEIGKLTGRERIELFLGAAVSDDYPVSGSFMLALIKSLVKCARGFSRSALVRIIELVSVKNSIPVPEHADNIIDVLCTLEILTESSGLYYPAKVELYEAAGSTEFEFILQPNFDIIADRRIPFYSGVILALFADITRFSDLLSFRLTKESFVRGLEAGFTGEDIIVHLKKYTGHGIPQNVMFSLQSWEKEFRSIEIFSGIILTADEKKRKIIDNSPYLCDRILKKLGEGIYLVNPGNIENLKKTLRSSGIENVPPFEEHLSESFSDRSFNNNRYENDIAGLKNFKALENLFFRSVQYPETVDIDMDLFERRIEDLNFTSEQKKIIKRRILRKIILLPEQITQGSARYEKNEAKGLDYMGKLRIAEQALENQGYLLEIVERKSDIPVTSLVKPEAINKSGKDVILEGLALPDEEPVKIFIRKASLVKKIKTSLFMK